MTDARPRFEPVSRRTISEEIRDALLLSIRRGDLLPGAPLPSERELASDFGVARTSVREAVQGLAGVGAVERRGNRLHVAERFPDFAVGESDARKRRVQELFEVRRIIEVPLAELAASRARAIDIEEICEIADRFHAGLPLEEFRALDREFHWAVARASGNELLAELYGKVLESLFRSYEFDSLLTATGNQLTVKKLIKVSTLGHRAIANALRQGDAAFAASAVADHLRQVETDMISRMT
ncbi:MAG TPA: FCD domain-containing protein [Acidimicrobiales bacterium]|nr:FCD domain-containing protein [Acidimicrobiales bacterium]